MKVADEIYNYYVPSGHDPHAKPMMDLYFDAQSELLIPFPSIKLNAFSKLGYMTGGLRPYEFSILCGSTGVGKTTLCANLSCDLAHSQVPQFILSVETGANDYAKRMMSYFANEDWNDGEKVSTEKLKIFNGAHQQLFKNSRCYLSLYDDRTTVETLMANIAFMHQNHGAKVVIVDNMNFFLEVTSANNAVIEMDRVIHELIIFCKKFPIHLIMVMHPRKNLENRVESEFDVKGSSTAIQEAHNVFLFNRPSQWLIENGHATSNDREITIAKMRRKGKFVRKKLVLKSENGVRYTEGDVF